ncbi:Uncharacterized lipoprotein YddW, UPF0748 family [Lachnospiraceae bacterium]|nr:Uncharacterized lipoprotein YddW, UPF0748 family [Lachnospiraceae bacterium]
MKFLKKFLAVLMAVTVIAGMTGAGSVSAEAAAPAGLKGVWVSFLDWQLFLKGKDQASFDAAFGSICDTAAANGLNALFVHVRSHNDAVYPSNIYPWSTMMLNGNPGYDPLAEMVSIAHSKGLQFHAWINPYGYRNGVITGNPALATNSNVVAGVQEIVNNYAVDGIHFDDYFPAIGKASVNSMVSSVHQVCAASGKVFGISPAGNLSNLRASSADVDTWLSTPGYVDYLAPQIYWSDQYGAAGNIAMYSNRIAQFKAIDTAGIPLYVGLAAYKAGQPIGSDPGWTLNSSNLATQCDKARAQGYTGYILYRYNTLLSGAASAELAGLRSRG